MVNNMMNVQVGNASVSFIDGKLKLEYFNVIFDAGVYPDRLNGGVQVTPADGVTIASTEDEVKASAKAKIQALVADEAPKAN